MTPVQYLRRTIFAPASVTVLLSSHPCQSDVFNISSAVVISLILTPNHRRKGKISLYVAGLCSKLLPKDSLYVFWQAGGNWRPSCSECYSLVNMRPASLLKGAALCGASDSEATPHESACCLPNQPHILSPDLFLKALPIFIFLSDDMTWPVVFTSFNSVDINTRQHSCFNYLCYYCYHCCRI